MSDTVNPYESPEAGTAPEKTLASQAALTDKMLSYLRQASPWLRFVGIVGFIFTGFTALSGFSMIFMSGTMADTFNFLGMGGAASALNAFMIIIIFGSAVILFFMSLYSYRFGEKIRRYNNTGRDEDLELGFKNNKSYWKLYGIIMIVSLAFIVLAVVISVIAMIAAAAMF